MKKFYINYADPSLIKRISLDDNNNFNSISIGVSDVENLLITLIKKTISYPIYFVVEEFEVIISNPDTIIPHNIEFIKVGKSAIITIRSDGELRTVIEVVLEVLNYGYTIFVIEGNNLDPKFLMPKMPLIGRYQFNSLVFKKVRTILDVNEMGIVIHTNNNNINAPVKLIQYIPNDYLLDEENSNLNS